MYAIACINTCALRKNPKLMYAHIEIVVAFLVVKTLSFLIIAS